MSELHAVRCKACGGAVVARPETELPECLFCGAPAAQLAPESTEDLEPPTGWIGFAVTTTDARSAFQRFAKSSMWYPNDLRRAKLELKPLLLPAWAWSGDLETHWTGLVRAQTRSGKRPLAGAESIHLDQVLVPASQTLTIAELTQLGAYDESALSPYDADSVSDPMELPEMTRSVARQEAQAEMERRHRAKLSSEHSTVELNTASICADLTGAPVLVPVYIGAYRYGKGLYRVLVNGQTGALVGKAPISYWKVALAVIVGLMLVAAIFAAIGSCAGGIALFEAVAR